MLENEEPKMLAEARPGLSARSADVLKESPTEALTEALTPAVADGVTVRAAEPSSEPEPVNAPVAATSRSAEAVASVLNAKPGLSGLMNLER